MRPGGEGKDPSTDSAPLSPEEDAALEEALRELVHAPSRPIEGLRSSEGPVSVG